MGSYVVQRGDSWAKIAGSQLGNQRFYLQLANANGGLGRVLQPGDTVNWDDSWLGGSEPVITQQEFDASPTGMNDQGFIYGGGGGSTTTTTGGGGGAATTVPKPKLPNIGPPAVPNFVPPRAGQPTNNPANNYRPLGTTQKQNQERPGPVRPGQANPQLPVLRPYQSPPGLGQPTNNPASNYKPAPGLWLPQVGNASAPGNGRTLDPNRMTGYTGGTPLQKAAATTAAQFAAPTPPTWKTDYGNAGPPKPPGYDFKAAVAKQKQSQAARGPGPQDPFRPLDPFEMNTGAMFLSEAIAYAIATGDRSKLPPLLNDQIWQRMDFPRGLYATREAWLMALGYRIADDGTWRLYHPAKVQGYGGGTYSQPTYEDSGGGYEPYEPRPWVDYPEYEPKPWVEYDNGGGGGYGPSYGRAVPQAGQGQLNGLVQWRITG